MTDRELLQAAAKAAGIVALRAPDGSLRDCTGRDPAMNIFSAPHWNPLTDDGDALRLAVALGLVVDCSRPSAGVPFYSHEFAEIRNADTAAATRRAIVRAAAALAKGKA